MKNKISFMKSVLAIPLYLMKYGIDLVFKFVRVLQPDTKMKNELLIPRRSHISPRKLTMAQVFNFKKVVPVR